MDKTVSNGRMQLYYLMGEALCMTQLLEDSLSHSITLKKDVRHPNNCGKEKAREILEQHRSVTLGSAVKLIREENLYSDTLRSNLERFLKERNWLIHKCLPYYLDEPITEQSSQKLLNRIKAISHSAIILRRSVDIDLVEFSESIGMDMSNVRAAIRQFDYET